MITRDIYVIQFAAAVENMEITNLKRLQFCWFAGKTNSAVPEDLRGRSKGSVSHATRSCIAFLKVAGFEPLHFDYYWPVLTDR